MKVERTEKKGRLNQRSVLVAAVVADLLLLILALAHRVLAAQLGAPAMTVRIAPDVLERLPLRIADWTGEDVPMDKTISRNTDSDSLVRRRYSHHDGRDAVELYITCGANASELLRHHPENCYTGAGWLLANRRSAELSTSDGKALPCTIYEFVRNRLGTERMTALLYLVVDGQHYGSIPAVKWRVWRRDSAVSYAAEVQIVASAGVSGDTVAAEAVSHFAIDSFPSIARLFDRITEN